MLRNNNVPAILTEGSYISIPESEKQLRSGKGLTKEAEILWKSLRKAYSKGSLKIDFYSNEDEKLIVNSPYFNILFTANKTIKSVNARINNAKLDNVGLKNIMAFPLTYSIYNTKPLKSGEYELSVLAKGYEGLASPRKNVKLYVVLPVSKIELSSVVPQIPIGYKGQFPLDIKIYDSQNNINTRSVKAKIEYGNKTTVVETNPSGITTALLELDGKDVGEIKIKVTIEDEANSEIAIPVVMPLQHCVIGQLTGVNNEPLAKAKISYDGKTITQTNDNGYFYFEYELSVDKLDVEVEPCYGHKNLTYTIKNHDSMVVYPLLNTEASYPALYNKKIAIMAKDSLDNMVRSLAKPLVYAGAKLVRLNMPVKMTHPEYEAVLEANLIKDLNMVISLKSENIPSIQIRHYHNSKNGKKLAEAVRKTFKDNYPKIPIKTCAGSDYELGHTGATAIVIALPTKPNENTREALIDQLSKALKNNN